MRRLCQLGYPGLTLLRALGAIRTRTVQILGLVPLPLGHEGLAVPRPRRDLNSRPPESYSGALSAELRGQDGPGRDRTAGLRSAEPARYPLRYGPMSSGLVEAGE